MRLIRFAALPLLALAACAEPPPYVPAEIGDVTARGYTDARLAPGRFRVAFSANSLTPREIVEDYLLFRAAEVASENGCPFFRVDRRETAAGDRGNVGDPGFRISPSIGIGVIGQADEPDAPVVSAGKSRVGFGFGFGFPLYGYDRTPARRGLTAYAEITCLAEDVPGDPDVFDAREVIATIGPRVAFR